MIDALGILGQSFYDLRLCENLTSFNGRDIILEVPVGYQYASSLFSINRSSRHMEKQLGKVSRIREYVTWLKRIAVRARQWQPDIIHWQFGLFCLFDYLIIRYLQSQLPKSRIVITLHDARSGKPTWNHVIARKRFFRSANGVVVHSEEARNNYLKWIGPVSQSEAVRVILHGPYDTPASPNLSSNEIRRHFGLDPQGSVIISIGSINKNKDFSRGVKLVGELQKLCPTVNFLIAGTSAGYDMNVLQKERNQAPSPERIVIMDRYLTDDEVDQAHCIADFSLLIYNASVTSGAAVRSLCGGVPVICNDCPGFRAVVIDGKNGIMVDENNPAAEAPRIHQTLKNPETLNDMKEKALASYQGITWDQVALKHYNFYRELLGSHA